jgi:tetrahydromethanopterin S-methyltransferase subunit C
VSSRLPTAPLAAGGLIGGYGVAVASGSRPLGGVVLAVIGLMCAAIWARRDGRRVAIYLTVAGLAAFALSHGLAIIIGAWPAELAVSAAVAAVCWRLSDAPRLRRRRSVARGVA